MTVVRVTTIKNMDLFFDFTALFIVFAYTASMITLLTIKKEWKSGQNIKTLLGIGTALLMMFFAAQDIFKQVTKKGSSAIHVEQRSTEDILQK